MVDTPDLGSGASRCGGSSPLIRTTLDTIQAPILSNVQPLWETFEKLNLIEKQLKRLDLYNSKHLYKRDNIYYFTLRVDSNTVIKKSLRTSNYLHAIILKVKIMILVDNIMAKKRKSEEEMKLMDEIKNTLLNKLNKLQKNHTVNVTTKATRKTYILSTYTDKYLDFIHLKH